MSKTDSSIVHTNDDGTGALTSEAQNILRRLSTEHLKVLDEACNEMACTGSTLINVRVDERGTITFKRIGHGKKEGD
jgi:hypothetical protein